MMTSTQAPSAAFQACVDELHRLAPFLIDRWSSKLAVALYERSLVATDTAQRHQIQDAIAFLKKHRAAIVQGFSDGVRKAIAADMLPTTKSTIGKSAKSGRALSSLSFDDLELMGDMQVQQAVESARLHQIVRLGCETASGSFSARLSTAQGFLVVKGDNNPLRPETVTLVLSELLQSLPISAQTRVYWLLDGARIMGEELQSLYVALNDFLAGLGVVPAAYGILGVPPAKTSGAATRAAPVEDWDQPQTAAALPARADARFINPRPDSEMFAEGSKPLLTLDHLHHLLMGDYENSVPQVSSFSQFATDEVEHQDFSHTVPTALDVLSELEEQGLVAAGMKLTRHAPPMPVAKLRARFKTGAKTLGQSLAIEVVGLMIEQMANDERLLPPVRQIVASVEPAFLQLAVTDPRFFSDKSHPARRLLEAITSESLGYASEGATGFSEFLQHLQEIAASLAADNANDSDHFASLLQTFEHLQNRNSPENRRTQRLAVQALLQAEKRNSMAVKIASEIRMHPDFIDCNRVITAFLTGPWAQVMARERLSEQSVTPGNGANIFSLTLGDLLWSLDSQQVAGHRRRLVKMIPNLLESLRKGLATIDFPVEHSQPFFNHLMALHQDVLKTWKETASGEAKSTHSLEKMFVSSEEANAGPLWLAPSEVRHSGFIQDPDASSTELSVKKLNDPHESMPGDLSAQAGANEESIDLNVGDWVDLLVEMQWLRAQLTWMSPGNTLFMFTSQGGRKHSMTSRVLRHLAKLDLVKVVSQQGVFEGALDSIARVAMQNSVLDKSNS